ncbi:G5 domain-containing protein [Streptococcus suis]|uniref:G5 domain-containing protein n=1 Tax=Streptococcus suis TaxID=1307 RepID=UPI00298FFE5E|nr:G5 domain-containing protein [Streptococcus suis]HEL1636886.1 G5 domain-containing protein [Streptococcus suis]
MTVDISSGWNISAEIIKQVLTLENAIKISEGKITLENRQVDSLLLGSDILPDNDNDGDGLANKEEIYTYEKDKTTYFGYYSHPFLKDSDGDGFSDGTERTVTDSHPQLTDPLKWDVTSREMAMFMELAYRDDDYIRKVLDPLQPLDTLYDGRQEYAMMHKELSPYWRMVRTFHENNGFDAVLFETTSNYPFINAGEVQVLAIRGTKGTSDVDDDLSIFFATNPKQANSIERLMDQLQQSTQINNLYLTGHSLGGYLAQRGFIYANQKNYDWAKKSYTFNAPKIKGLVSNLNGIAAIGDQLTNEGKSIHYATDNDTLITNGVGHFSGTKFVGKSVAGHGSRSFLEPLMNGQYDFTTGDKKSINETGYIDPKLANLYYFTLPEANVYEPIFSNEEIFEGEEVDFNDNLTNSKDLPNTITIQDITPKGTVNTNKEGDYLATVQVLYSDNSYDVLQIPVKVHKKDYPTSLSVALPEAVITEKEIPFDTLYQDDPTLPVGQEFEQVAGVTGKTNVISIGDQTTEVVTTAKVDRIVRVGTKLAAAQSAALAEAVITEKEIPFDTLYQDDPTLPVGQEFEQVAGVTGKTNVISIGDQTTEVITTAKVDRIVRVGTKLAAAQSADLAEAVITEKEIPFDTLYQEDPTLPVGQESEQVAGVTGKTNVISIGDQTTEVVTTAKVDRIVRVGTKLAAAQSTDLAEAVITEKEIPFDTLYQEDPTLPVGHQEFNQVAGVTGKTNVISIGDQTTDDVREVAAGSLDLVSTSDLGESREYTAKNKVINGTNTDDVLKPKRLPQTGENKGSLQTFFAVVGIAMINVLVYVKNQKNLIFSKLKQKM